MVRATGTVAKAVSAALRAASLRKSRTPSLATGERAHTSTGDRRGEELPLSGEWRNRDRAATNAAASSWCANSITWNFLGGDFAGIDLSFAIDSARRTRHSSAASALRLAETSLHASQKPW